MVINKQKDNAVGTIINRPKILIIIPKKIGFRLIEKTPLITNSVLFFSSMLFG